MGCFLCERKEANLSELEFIALGKAMYESNKSKAILEKDYLKACDWAENLLIDIAVLDLVLAGKLTIAFRDDGEYIVKSKI